MNVKELAEIIAADPIYERGPLYVTKWMAEKFHNLVRDYAANFFNGDVVVLPDKMEEKK